MPVIDTITKRMCALQEEGKPDVYIYDFAPEKIRAQTIHILQDCLDNIEGSASRHFWESIYKAYIPEIGKLDIGRLGDEFKDKIIYFVMKKATHEETFDLIDVSFRVINNGYRRFLVRHHNTRGATEATQAINDMNSRLRESKIGFSFEESSNKLVPIGAEFTHNDIVRPALELLRQLAFEEANKELLMAFDHVASASWKDAITAAARSFEATMKAICKRRGWPYKEEMRATDLVKVCRDRGLFPAWLDEGLTSFIAMMKTSVPSVRNKAGAHGSSPDAEKVTQDLAMYAIHEAASLILLFLERYKALG